MAYFITICFAFFGEFAIFGLGKWVERKDIRSLQFEGYLLDGLNIDMFIGLELYSDDDFSGPPFLCEKLADFLLSQIYFQVQIVLDW